MRHDRPRSLLPTFAAPAVSLCLAAVVLAPLAVSGQERALYGEWDLAAGAVGAPTWREAVANVAALPATGNTAGDARVAIAEGEAHYWDGDSWELLAGGGSPGTLCGSHSDVDCGVGPGGGQTLLWTPGDGTWEPGFTGHLLDQNEDTGVETDRTPGDDVLRLKAEGNDQVEIATDQTRILGPVVRSQIAAPSIFCGAGAGHGTEYVSTGTPAIPWFCNGNAYVDLSSTGPDSDDDLSDNVIFDLSDAGGAAPTDGQVFTYVDANSRAEWADAAGGGGPATELDADGNVWGLREGTSSGSLCFDYDNDGVDENDLCIRMDATNLRVGNAVAGTADAFFLEAARTMTLRSNGSDPIVLSVNGLYKAFWNHHKCMTWGSHLSATTFGICQDAADNTTMHVRLGNNTGAGGIRGRIKPETYTNLPSTCTPPEIVYDDSGAYCYCGPADTWTKDGPGSGTCS